MKSSLMGVFLFLMSVSWAFAQQVGAQPDNSASGGNRSGPRASVFISSVRSSIIRIIGAPRNQQNPGRNVECSPVEQSVVGDIIGPTDLCDR